MALSSRDNLKNYAFRKLGAPVVEINVDDQQVEDLIDDSLQLLSEYHFDGIERFYLTHTITQTDYDNRYISITNNNIVSVLRLYPVGFESHAANMFDVRYQLALSDFYGLQNLDLSHWAMVQQHLTLLQQMLEPEKNLRFSRVTNRLHIDADWGNDLAVGSKIIVECYAKLDPETYTEIYDNILLKKYVTALVKRQWGQNLSKFGGLQLPGGVEFNGSEIYDQANEECNKIEEEIQDKYELPTDFYTG
jgi:hypothetical protein